MPEFKFETTDNSSNEYCLNIINKMTFLFGISNDEAIGRMNRLWNGLKLLGEYDLIYHEDVDYWAKTIYYGKDSAWWLNPPKLKPKPYP